MGSIGEWLAAKYGKKKKSVRGRNATGMRNNENKGGNLRRGSFAWGQITAIKSSREGEADGCLASRGTVSPIAHAKCITHRETFPGYMQIPSYNCPCHAIGTAPLIPATRRAGRPANERSEARGRRHGRWSGSLLTE